MRYSTYKRFERYTEKIGKTSTRTPLNKEGVIKLQYLSPFQKHFVQILANGPSAGNVVNTSKENSGMNMIKTREEEIKRRYIYLVSNIRKSKISSQKPRVLMNVETKNLRRPNGEISLTKKKN